MYYISYKIQKYFPLSLCEALSPSKGDNQSLKMAMVLQSS